VGEGNSDSNGPVRAVLISTMKDRDAKDPLIDEPKAQSKVEAISCLAGSHSWAWFTLDVRGLFCE